ARAEAGKKMRPNRKSRLTCSGNSFGACSAIRCRWPRAGHPGPGFSGCLKGFGRPPGLPDWPGFQGDPFQRNPKGAETTPPARRGPPSRSATLRPRATWMGAAAAVKLWLDEVARAHEKRGIRGPRADPVSRFALLLPPWHRYDYGVPGRFITDRVLLMV